MPSLKALSHFYGHVYRAGALNPYRVQSPRSMNQTVWADSQLMFIQRHVDINDLGRNADIGCGYGYLLREMKQKYPHLQQFAFDEDLGAASYLKRYGVTLNPNPIPRVDLCVSSHSLEHFTDPHAFVDFLYKLHPTYLFLEVPNCDDLSDLFLQRSYDSPHLLFFSKNSLTQLANQYQWSILDLDTVGCTIEEEAAAARAQKEYMEKLANMSCVNTAVEVSKVKIKGLLKSVLPVTILESYRDRNPAQLQQQRLTTEWYQYGGKRWSLRGLFKLTP
jgi:hypothetical protein